MKLLSDLIHSFLQLDSFDELRTEETLCPRQAVERCGSRKSTTFWPGFWSNNKALIYTTPASFFRSLDQQVYTQRRVLGVSLMNFRTATWEATTVMDRRPTTAMAVIDNIAVTGLVNDFINVVVVLPCPILTAVGASILTVAVAWVATEMATAETIINREDNEVMKVIRRKTRLKIWASITPLKGPSPVTRDRRVSIGGGWPLYRQPTTVTFWWIQLTLMAKPTGVTKVCDFKSAPWGQAQGCSVVSRSSKSVTRRLHSEGRWSSTQIVAIRVNIMFGVTFAGDWLEG